MIDTYSKVAFAKLYDRKNALTASDMLHDKVLPWLEEENIRALRLLNFLFVPRIESLSIVSAYNFHDCIVIYCLASSKKKNGGLYPHAQEAGVPAPSSIKIKAHVMSQSVYSLYFPSFTAEDFERDLQQALNENCSPPAQTGLQTSSLFSNTTSTSPIGEALPHPRCPSFTLLAYQYKLLHPEFHLPFDTTRPYYLPHLGHFTINQNLILAGLQACYLVHTSADPHLWRGKFVCFLHDCQSLGFPACEIAESENLALYKKIHAFIIKYFRFPDPASTFNGHIVLTTVIDSLLLPAISEPKTFQQVLELFDRWLKLKK